MSDTETSSPAKRQKKNEDSLICPISHALPINPVIAEDGHIYEKEAIEEYIESNKTTFGSELTSPFTRQKMGDHLLAVPQIKSTIETMIENGAIAGELADEWKNAQEKQAEQKKKTDSLLEKAAGGNVNAMEQVANDYNLGSNGFKKDKKEAYNWYKKAHAAGSVLGMAKQGDMLLSGSGVATNFGKGMMYLGMAEGRGSDFAALILGLCMADGSHGVAIDTVEASKLLEKALSGNYEYKHMSEELKAAGQQKLDQLQNPSAPFTFGTPAPAPARAPAPAQAASAFSFLGGNAPAPAAVTPQFYFGGAAPPRRTIDIGSAPVFHQDRY